MPWCRVSASPLRGRGKGLTGLVGGGKDRGVKDRGGENSDTGVRVWGGGSVVIFNLLRGFLGRAWMVIWDGVFGVCERRIWSCGEHLEVGRDCVRREAERGLAKRGRGLAGGGELKWLVEMMIRSFPWGFLVREVGFSRERKVLEICGNRAPLRGGLFCNITYC